MAQAIRATSPDKQIVVRPGQCQLSADTDSICLSVDGVHQTGNLKTFMSFLCDKQATDLTTAIRSSVELFNYCIPSREAVLQFYSDLITEYNTYYWINKKRASNLAHTITTHDEQQQGIKEKIEYVGELTRRFVEMEKLKLADAREDQETPDADRPSPSKPTMLVLRSPPRSRLSTSSNLTGPDSPTASGSQMSPTETKIIPTTPKEIPTRRTSSCNSQDMEQTPMSPSHDIDMNSGDDDRTGEDNVEAIDIFSELEKQIVHIRGAFKSLFAKYKLIEFDSVATNQLDHLTSSFTRQKERFRTLITHWASGLLIQLNNKHSDISLMISSDQRRENPSNILTKQIDLWTSNPFNKLLIDLILESNYDVRQLFDCLAASKQNCDWLLAYTLLEMSKQSDHEKSFTLCMEYVIGGSCNINSLTFILAYLSDKNPKAMTNFPKSNIPKLDLDLISKLIVDKLNVSTIELSSLVAKSKINPSILLTKQINQWFSNSVNKLLIDLILESQYDVRLLFDRLATSKQNCDWLLAYILLEMSKQTDQNKSFNICMEYVLSGSCNINSVTYILAYLSDKNPKAMASYPKSNLPILDLDLLGQLIVDKLCAASLDINSIGVLLELCSNSLERVEHTRIRISTKYKLCMSLATCFFLLLEMEGDNLPEILHHIRVSLTCMSHLKQSSVSSHILCRALLERSLVYGNLFNKSFNPHLIGTSLESSDWNQDYTIKLSKENLKISLGHRFRRLPNHRVERESINNGAIKNGKSFGSGSPQEKSDGKPDRQAINSYLLIEAFKSSIHDINAFANLFVEFHCPVVFDRQTWPSDETLKVIDEKNLGILRRFEQIPPFWDLFELIGQEKCLKNCLVLVKALLAAHLAMWASATAKSCPDKMTSTTRLIPPLAESGLVPKAFGLTVEVFPHLSPNEVFAVLSDLWQYLKETIQYVKSEDSATQEQLKGRARVYLNRLRLFMCQHMPGSTYVKIFKELYTPPPLSIPT